MNKTPSDSLINSSYRSDFDCLFQPSNLDIDSWDRINEIKAQFLSGMIDLQQTPCICPEIAESWQASKNNRIDPYITRLEQTLPAKEFEELLVDKKNLIKTASSYIKKFMPLLKASEYIMCLTNETGVVLLLEGSEREVEAFEKLNIGLATNLSEEKVGTTAHSLCIRHHKPVQIIGPYNYLAALQNNISSATPIMDENNEVIGTVVVVQMLTQKNLHNLNAHSLGWVVAMGYAIENLLKVKKRNLNLSLTNSLLNTTLSLVDEGILTINKEGIICHLNKEGAVILGRPAETIVQRHYSEFVNYEQARLIAEALTLGKSTHDYETVINGHDETGAHYLLNIMPVLDDGVPNGAVIRLIRSQKVDRLVVQRGGSIARYNFDDIIGASPALLNTIKTVKNIGRKPINVLLSGESGTGKELFAQAIHNEARAGGPFIAINCASMPRNLIESELFGYEGGAFTGAERKGRPGKIELANNGTLFLDEIGDMPLEIQPVLLRILEDKRVMRLGGTRNIAVDFRIIAATNKNLLQMVHEKSFREDLYYRLSVFKVTIPPLRDRGDDSLILARYFIDDICGKLGLQAPKLSAEAERKIRAYSWPGNARQLQNAMAYAVTVSQNGLITRDDLPEELYHNPPRSTAQNAQKVQTLGEIEKNAILNTLELTRHNTIEAARILGIGRTTIYRKMKEYGITD